jgi:tRNA modification GTPase
MGSRFQEGLIAALATPLGQSALAVLRTSGTGCIEALSGAFSRPAALAGAAGHQMVYGSIIDPRTSTVVDEVMLGVFRAPRSYTGEDMVEIYAHGSVPGLDRLFDTLFHLGFRQALGGEFTLRAFLNGKLDLTRAEAVQEIVGAQSRTAQALALHRLAGAVESRIEQFKRSLVEVLAAVSIQLDYPEDEVDALDWPAFRLEGIKAGLESLARSYQAGRVYQHGARLVLAGRTNAGKSSLFNALVREERAIVSEIHGTTRDWLEAPFAVKGIPVRLFDTAGLREADELIEAEGIRRSGQVIASAALVLYLVDAAAPAQAGGDIVPEDWSHLADLAGRGIPVVVVWNKTDVPGARPAPAILELGGAALPVRAVSARTLDGVDGLIDAIAASLLPAAAAEDADVLIDSERQFRLLERAATAIGHVLEAERAGLGPDLLALDLQDAVSALGEITGEVTSEDVLETMFSNFCVGK